MESVRPNNKIVAPIAVFFLGAVSFFLGLSGILGSISALITGAGLVFGILGAWWFTSLWSRRYSEIPVSALIIAAIAGGLHFYETIFSSAGVGSFLIFGLLIIPYAFGLVLCSLSPTRHAANIGLILALFFDAYIHYTTFFVPKSSTAGLSLLFSPLINTFAVIPLGTVLGAIVFRLLRRWF